MSKNRLVKSVTCAYYECGARSRDNEPSRRFFSLPTSVDPEILQEWFVNCGIVHLADAPANELKKLRICSEHFHPNVILGTGRLMRNAVPIPHDVQPIIYNDGPTPEDHATWVVHKRSLTEQILLRDNEIAKLERQNLTLQLTLKHTRLTLSRRIKKMEHGEISDSSLAKAVARRVQGTLYTFITMQLFHKDKTVYDETEKELAEIMYTTSPRLYAKMRDFFGFMLPSPKTLQNW